MRLNHSYALALLAVCGLVRAETVTLKSTASLWLSDANDEERNSSGGKCGQFKIKSIQEMGAIRFDAAPVKGKEVLKARLFLHRDSPDKLRYIRVSTIAQNWEEGNSNQSYGKADGATFMFADANSKRSWAWPGSQFCDASMSAGNTLSTWAERQEVKDGWISVELTPQLIYELVADDTDGLAVCDGGNLALANNMISSVHSGKPPYIEVETGKALADAPAVPAVKAEADPAHAHLNSGAIQLTFDEAKNVGNWRITLNGKPVERWRVRHPAANGPTVFAIEDLTPSEKCDLQITAVAPGGISSSPAKLSVAASPALPLPVELGAFEPVKDGAVNNGPGPMKVWALPALVKLSPEKRELLLKAEAGAMPIENGNPVWNGSAISLFGARGEYVSFQLCIENEGAAPLKNIAIKPEPLKSDGGGEIGPGNIELFKNWYAKNGDKQWQPAYCIPMSPQQTLEVPDPVRKLPRQENQTVYIDVYIPKDAKPGDYTGSLAVTAEGASAFTCPVKLKVFDFSLPDKLSFWPELNGYGIPKNPHACFKLAQQHRCVINLNTSAWAPQLSGAGKNIKVDWAQFDANAGPLLSGDLFKANRRAGVPLEVMYLPNYDSWPTPLTKENYNYQGQWPKQGESNDLIVEHDMKAPYIGDGLNQSYKDAFHAVERQFIDHFKEKGWNKTEMQCFYGGKNTHRTQYGVNMWWTTDEPYHWSDWLALQFFDKLWVEGRGDGDPKIWTTRGDISRPNWQGRVMDGVLSEMYIGGFSSPASYRRGRNLHEETGVNIRAYGGANKDTVSNSASVVMCLNSWLNGANAFLPWQCFGGDGALDTNDAGAGGGNALIVPGDRFGVEAVGDIRLKAMRDGEQLIEYLVLLDARHNLNREQLKAIVEKAVAIHAGRKAGAGADNADAMEFSALSPSDLSELRRNLALLIEKK